MKSIHLEQAQALLEDGNVIDETVYDRLEELQALAPADEQPMFQWLFEAAFVQLNS